MIARNERYLPRIADGELADRLSTAGAVLIEGPRGCGKTATASQAAASSVLLDVDAAARAAGELDPSILLDGDQPRLIDEWQLMPAVWNHVRRRVDADQHGGQFILTGSAVPHDDYTRHSGALRIQRLRMRPMSLAESGHSTGAVALRALLAGDAPRAADSGVTLRDVAERIVVGGWPRLIEATPVEARRALSGYLDETRRVDLQRADGVHRDPENVGRVLSSLARNNATPAAVKTIAADAGGRDKPTDRHTVAEYLDALTRVFVLENLPAWSPSLRSRSVLRETPVRHFVDPSLAAAALGATPERLLGDFETLGLLFESLVLRDLRVYAQPIEGSLYHYRDNTGLEADAVIELSDGRWAAVEVKLGGQKRIDEGARHLLRLAERVDVASHGEPIFLAVIVATGYAYQRNDGIAVIPLGALGP